MAIYPNTPTVSSDSRLTDLFFLHTFIPLYLCLNLGIENKCSFVLSSHLFFIVENCFLRNSLDSIFFHPFKQYPSGCWTESWSLVYLWSDFGSGIFIYTKRYDWNQWNGIICSRLNLPYWYTQDFLFLFSFKILSSPVPLIHW